MKRGSALLIALWVIMALSVIVMSFSYEAKQQGGVNIYVQNKNRVKRLLDSGCIIGEVVLLNYKDAKQWTEDENLEEELEEDRWYVEKQSLKYSKGCTIGPILLDEENLDSGTVKIDISLSSGDVTTGININKLNKEDDPNFEDRWRVILDMCGVPREEVNDEDGKPVGLQSYIIACWQDYRDQDENRYDISDTTEYEGAEGAEKPEYEEYYEDHKKFFADEDRYEPANGEITDLKELSRVLCFQKFPGVLTGGQLLPDREEDRRARRSRRSKNDDDTITIPRGLINLGIFSVTGDGKLNVNNCTVDQLLTVPGIFNVEDIDDNDMSKSRELAEAIVKCRNIKPEDYDVPEDEGRTEWGYGEFDSDWWSDMVKRVSDYQSDLEIPEEAKKYLTGQPSDDGSLFKMKITAALMDMEYSVECECYVKDKEVRYISWKEE